jgi:hypothetical protein
MKHGRPDKARVAQLPSTFPISIDRLVSAIRSLVVPGPICHGTAAKPPERRKSEWGSVDRTAAARFAPRNLGRVLPSDCLCNSSLASGLPPARRPMGFRPPECPCLAVSSFQGSVVSAMSKKSRGAIGARCDGRAFAYASACWFLSDGRCCDVRLSS